MSPSDETDTLAFAVNLCEGAKALLRTVPHDQHNGMSIPFFLLIGFSIENGLKSAIEFKLKGQSGAWSKSHDLTMLRELALQHGFVIADASAVTLIDSLSPLHREHQFRYPQKAGIASLIHARGAHRLVDEMLAEALVFIGGMARF